MNVSEEAAAAYSDECIGRLIDTYRLSVTPDELRIWLEKAGANYLLCSARLQNPEQRAARRRRFATLSRLAAGLREELSGEDDDTFVLKMGVSALADEAAGLLKPRLSETDIAAGKHLDLITYHSDSLITLLRCVEDVCHADEAGADENGGRPSDEACYRYAEYLADFWTRIAGRRFTLDYHKGRGLTEAFAFVRDAMAPLAPVPESRLITACRRVVAELRARKNWSPD